MPLASRIANLFNQLGSVVSRPFFYRVSNPKQRALGLRVWDCGLLKLKPELGFPEKCISANVKNGIKHIDTKWEPRPWH
jgi:hypothetical protein